MIYQKDIRKPCRFQIQADCRQALWSEHTIKLKENIYTLKIYTYCSTGGWPVFPEIRGESYQ